MLELFFLLLFNALFIIGIFVSSQEGMILYFLRKPFLKPTESDLDEQEYHWPYLYKPLIGCPTCMASIHSTYFYWFFQDCNLDNLYIYPFYIIALAGLNALLHKYIDAL
jgi:hypothetical protein